MFKIVFVIYLRSMSFTEYIPAAPLRDYIDAYWVRVTPAITAAHVQVSRRIYADGCSDIFTNTSTYMAYFNATVSLSPGHLYLGGTMTAFGVVSSIPGSIFTGVRFRPGGFFALYRVPMEEALDLVIEFPDRELLSLMKDNAAQGFVSSLDVYFLAKPINLKHDFVSIYKKIYRLKGQLSVEDLSKDSHVSHRTIDRIFKQNVGTHPKEFIRIVRFQEVLKRLRTAASGQVPHESLLRIAYELGYYDHAHLTNEFKKYSGITPSEWGKEQ
jgi:AraC-like DNA-binding protein